ncbi:alternative ribosome rescue aminoacyl-tRNA hydrolase ArfB [Rhodobaculum claviforme]|uniref:Aminoacyl-tRNA hydrolase n=1 Tax=Rhodobaculum claviforme TaxID=1549854 RepID=A0A934TIS4_9RHOB|nr:alternative ribosome rescue aminoacyl-tRNA hydrolase ArfB [Rhodobaculum claviforme]MBK5926246.1 aminoacyl-tRNA hydrolase [Rhodobaculum claviforme]
MLPITDTLALADWEITETFTRSSGPGGQNVNKVSSAVELRFEAERSPNLTPEQKARLRRLAGRRWTLDGAVILRVEDTRSQARNREIARDRLVELVRAALSRPRRRIPTRPTLGSQRRRLASKAARGGIKALRGRVTPEE